MGKGLGVVIQLLWFMDSAGKGAGVTVRGNQGPRQHEENSSGQGGLQENEVLGLQDPS